MNNPASTAATVILVDVSGSMDDSNKISMVKKGLETIWPEMEGARLLAFSSDVTPCSSPEELPEPYGATAMHLALDEAAKLMPAKVIVMSDGEPNDEGLALKAADGIPGVIDTFYCGDDDNKEAIAFMAKLGRLGGGQSVVNDIVKTKALVAPILRDILGLPSPIAL